MKHEPLSRQRSPWVQFDAFETPSGPVHWLRRDVNDGRLLCCVADEEPGWHLSISHRDHRGRNKRYPTWDEISHARDELLPDDLEFVMHFPKEGEYVSVHETTFHLWQYPPR